METEVLQPGESPEDAWMQWVMLWSSGALIALLAATLRALWATPRWPAAFSRQALWCGWIANLSAQGDDPLDQQVNVVLSFPHTRVLGQGVLAGVPFWVGGSTTRDGSISFRMVCQQHAASAGHRAGSVTGPKQFDGYIQGSGHTWPPVITGHWESVEEHGQAGGVGDHGGDDHHDGLDHAASTGDGFRHACQHRGFHAAYQPAMSAMAGGRFELQMHEGAYTAPLYITRLLPFLESAAPQVHSQTMLRSLHYAVFHASAVVAGLCALLYGVKAVVYGEDVPHPALTVILIAVSCLIGAGVPLLASVVLASPRMRYDDVRADALFGCAVMATVGLAMILVLYVMIYALFVDPRDAWIAPLLVPPAWVPVFLLPACLVSVCLAGLFDALLAAAIETPQQHDVHAVLAVRTNITAFATTVGVTGASILVVHRVAQGVYACVPMLMQAVATLASVLAHPLTRILTPGDVSVADVIGSMARQQELRILPHYPVATRFILLAVQLSATPLALALLLPTAMPTSLPTWLVLSVPSGLGAFAGFVATLHGADWPVPWLAARQDSVHDAVFLTTFVATHLLSRQMMMQGTAHSLEMAVMMLVLYVLAWQSIWLPYSCHMRAASQTASKSKSSQYLFKLLWASLMAVIGPVMVMTSTPRSALLGPANRSADVLLHGSLATFVSKLCVRPSSRGSAPRHGYTWRIVLPVLVAGALMLVLAPDMRMLALSNYCLGLVLSFSVTSIDHSAFSSVDGLVAVLLILAPCYTSLA